MNLIENVWQIVHFQMLPTPDGHLLDHGENLF